MKDSENPIIRQHSKVFLSAAAFLGLIFFSCTGKNDGRSIFQSERINIELFQKELYTELKPIDSRRVDHETTLLADVDYCTVYAYQLNDYKPFWFDVQGINEAGKELPKQIKKLYLEGLTPEDYNVHTIETIIQSSSKSSASLDSFKRWDVFLTKNYLKAARDLLLGSKETIKDPDWHIINDSVFRSPIILAHHFEKNSGFPSFDAYRPHHHLYQEMMSAAANWFRLSKDSSYLLSKENLQAHSDSLIRLIIQKELSIPSEDTASLLQLIAQYQHIHSLKSTGKIDELTLKILRNAPNYYFEYLISNMRKMQWMPQDFGKEYVWVNIPFMKMSYIKQDSVVFQCKAIVGKPNRATPSLSANMESIIFNPPWTVPPVIINNDIQSGVARSGADYLRRKGLRAFDSNGQDRTESVTSQNYKNFTFRQSPGPNNSLGQIKFSMPNPWHIYLHDTPHKSGFNQDYRAESSGCVRLSRPREFAAILLKDQHIDSLQIDSLIEANKTVSIKLKQKFPVYIVYLTVGLDDQNHQLIYLNDIYKKKNQPTQ